jgi:hypothetical protein
VILAERTIDRRSQELFIVVVDDNDADTQRLSHDPPSAAEKHVSLSVGPWAKRTASGFMETSASAAGSRFAPLEVSCCQQGLLSLASVGALS